eukprot:CAMPEP_0119345348 /NCGR_PEP_ID=MMETSP1333-20130426/107439_1 /TAXON_ID=418940 /ORGANISM="Scyphosphaera apsteinii, Strain RCC1455" /LENGTH=34 /DNA_ID= /DNA_START= /DNA_END= /DNA_ORIENTATION=
MSGTKTVFDESAGPHQIVPASGFSWAALACTTHV